MSDDPNEFSFYFRIGYAAPGDYYEDCKDEQEAVVYEHLPRQHLVLPLGLGGGRRPAGRGRRWHAHVLRLGLREQVPHERSGHGEATRGARLAGRNADGEGRWVDALAVAARIANFFSG